MSENAQPVFLVDAYADPIVVRIEGRASFLNSGSLKEFCDEMQRQGRARFIIDFANCASMDSTFLGVLAGTALALRKRTPPGGLSLIRVGERNLELIRNLGLHRLASIDSGGSRPAMPVGTAQALPTARPGEAESSRLVLEAHENLVAADPSNAARFQDVIAFLRNRAESR